MAKRRYYIDKQITFCYPYQASTKVKDYGVLSEHMGIYYDRAGIDKIICLLIKKHPCVAGAANLSIKICWEEDGIIGYYHIFDFENMECDNQKPSENKVIWEKRR